MHLSYVQQYQHISNIVIYLIKIQVKKIAAQTIM